MNKHYGSNFDDFLAEEGILGDVEAVAAKRVLAFQLEQEMVRQNLSKTAMAQQMGTSRAAVNRLLDPDNPSVTLQTLERAAAVLGKKLRLELT
ncbi:MAG: XRE family transcriptional regulator [Thermaceae bacterium]|nr:XRE family transcriptional regulator [Thermaceae bacterium]